MFEGNQATEVDAFLNSSEQAKRLYRRHQELDHAVLDAELGVLPIDDMTLSAMKKEKLQAKDRLTYMWNHRRN